ncbi:MAG TPA: NAD(P)/FAD-dependent oxidoreductase [Candidatus Limnocylindria bacterium]|nr:NAD(P)/FAD-dependent oxidoreductase [Candidatus Limnocylindria bacterium]
MEPRSIDVLLVGGGVAAARCARTLRRRGYAGSILIVSDEADPPYNRPPLSKELLQADLPAELVLAEPVAWYERQRVELLLSTPVTALDTESRKVTLGDGSSLTYGHCLIATGAAPRRPRIPGAEHALLLRTLPDSVAIRGRAMEGTRAVVIGGGFIGVEVAGSLAARGVATTVVEVADALWGGLLGPEVSSWAAERLAAAGVELRLGAACESVRPDGVSLVGERLSADLIVAGVGVTPRTELATAAGLTVDDGIVVDDGGRSSAEGVLAAGDVARPATGARVEHWHAARESGERAALSILAEPLPARRAPWVFSEFAGAKLDVVGWAPTWDKIVSYPGVIAYVVGGSVTQLAVMDAAVPVEEARSFVEQRPAAAELKAFVERNRIPSAGVP